MTSNPGTYALLLRARTEAGKGASGRADGEQDIEIGALGIMTVKPGVYVYVGSAFGPGGLRARVQRHVRGEGPLHWHVDYLRAVTALETVWYTHDAERRECTWASILRSLPGATAPLEGFGASDCNCPAHLARIGSAPSLSVFRTRLYERCPDHASVEGAGKNLVQ